MKINIMMVVMMMMAAHLEKIMMIEKLMVMMLMVTIVDIGDDGGGDEDVEKNGVIQLLVQMKGQNRQRKLRHFHLPTHQGPASGSPAPPASRGESSGLVAFQTDSCWGIRAGCGLAVASWFCPGL